MLVKLLKKIQLNHADNVSHFAEPDVNALLNESVFRLGLNSYQDLFFETIDSPSQDSIFSLRSAK